MNPAFLIFANTVLLTRLFVLFKDDVVTARPWVIKTLVELAVLLACYRLSGVGCGIAIVVVAANFIGWRWETHARRRKNLGRLLIGMGELLGLSFFFAPGLSVSLREGLNDMVGYLRDFSALAPLADISDAKFQLELAGLLLAGNEANLVIRAVFDLLELKPRALPSGKGEIDVGEFNRGRVIGLLERVLLYWFILHGQFGAIGFILAAKAFTRFKALDDRAFAEYVLIGTLLSACLAMLSGGVVQWLMR